MLLLRLATRVLINACTFMSPVIILFTYLQGKNDKHCPFTAHVLPDNYVYFESRESPDSFLTFKSSGVPGKPKEVNGSDPDSHFFVRVAVSCEKE